MMVRHYVPERKDDTHIHRFTSKMNEWIKEISVTFFLRVLHGGRHFQQTIAKYTFHSSLLWFSCLSLLHTSTAYLLVLVATNKHKQLAVLVINGSSVI